MPHLSLCLQFQSPVAPHQYFCDRMRCLRVSSAVPPLLGQSCRRLCGTRLLRLERDTAQHHVLLHGQSLGGQGERVYQYHMECRRESRG